MRLQFSLAANISLQQALSKGERETKVCVTATTGGGNAPCIFTNYLRGYEDIGKPFDVSPYVPCIDDVNSTEQAGVQLRDAIRP